MNINNVKYTIIKYTLYMYTYIFIYVENINLIKFINYNNNNKSVTY